MKVLLTGASGFVGSHVLDRLRAAGIPVALLLRPSSSPRFIAAHLAEVEQRSGAITDPASLPPALAGITHVIHCAGCTRAVKVADFYAVNQAGTRNLVEAANVQPSVRRFIHVSSLAAAGPALPSAPARESAPEHPVSHYGQSKLAGEQEVRQHCRSEFVILRPPAVYGPRDGEFFRLFQALQRHLAPKPSRQPLSLVFVHDLAGALVASLDHPGATREIFYVAASEVVTARGMADEIAAQMQRWALPLPLPTPLFWPVCLVEELRARLTGKPSVLSLQKYAELRAPGWVCDPAHLTAALGYTCSTNLSQGIRRTLAWYRQERWL